MGCMLVYDVQILALLGDNEAVGYLAQRNKYVFIAVEGNDRRVVLRRLPLRRQFAAKGVPIVS